MVDAWFGDLGLQDYAACFVEEGYETIEDLGLLARSGEPAIVEMIDICNQSVPKGKLSKHRFRRELILALLDLFSNMKDQLAQEADSMGDLEFLLDELQRASIRRKKEKKPSVKQQTVHPAPTHVDDSAIGTTLTATETRRTSTPRVEHPEGCASPISSEQCEQEATVSPSKDDPGDARKVIPSTTETEGAEVLEGGQADRCGSSAESTTSTATPSPVAERGATAARGPIARIKTAATVETPSKLTLASHSNPNATEGRSWVQGVRMKDQKQKRKQPKMQSFEEMKRNLLQSKSSLDTRVTAVPPARTVLKPSASVRN
eukprot:m.747019 g.747019  ORF g.747019 m.747019 type:complete len:318 (-) comp23142_c0_seq3:2783-3736(-)